MSNNPEDIYKTLYKDYKKGLLILTPSQQTIFKAILRGREDRIMKSKGDLGEALYCVVIAADDDVEKELKWWTSKENE